MPETMHVPPIRREVGGGGVAGEECLDPALREPALSADEESRVVVRSGPEVALENRYERPEQRLLSRITVLHPPDPYRVPLEIDVFSLEQARF